MRHYNLIKAEQCRLGVLMIQTPLGLSPARIPSCSLLSLAAWTRFARAVVKTVRGRRRRPRALCWSVLVSTGCRGPRSPGRFER